METLHIYIGFDQVESVAYHTLCHSILSRSSVPVAFHPLKQSMLKKIFNRERDPKQSNEFSFTRFLVPHLQNHQGWALFMDLDMLVRTDIAELFALRDETKAVQVVKHDYVPKSEVKYLGATQYKYPRKNWSSFVLWNCAHPSNKALTPHHVNTLDPLSLHRFQWLNDEEIGELPVSWNWLVDEYPLGYQGLWKKDIKNVHFTNGGAYFHEYAAKGIDFCDEWFTEHMLMDYCKQID